MLLKYDAIRPIASVVHAISSTSNIFDARSLLQVVGTRRRTRRHSVDDVPRFIRHGDVRRLRLRRCGRVRRQRYVRRENRSVTFSGISAGRSNAN